jgi:hypothetical protein
MQSLTHVIAVSKLEFDVQLHQNFLHSVNERILQADIESGELKKRCFVVQNDSDSILNDLSEATRNVLSIQQEIG